MPVILSFVFVLLIVSVLAGLLVRQRGRYLRSSTSFILTLVSLCLGSILTGSRLYYLQDHLEQKWLSVEGEVVSSEVIGDRAFHPDIRYRYCVSNQEYLGSTDLNTPPFGGKRNRLETAESIVGDFPVGKKIKVYYDPENPSISMLRIGIKYGIYIQLAAGILLLNAGLFGIMLNIPGKSNR